MAGGLHMKTGIAVASLLLAASLGARASAQEIPKAGVTTEEFVNFMSGIGETTTVEANDSKVIVPNANPSVIVSKVGDIEYDIQLYDCKGGRCTTLEYAAGWNDCTIAAESVSQWNAQRRWIKGYITNNTCYADFDIIIAPGTTYAYLAETLALWKDMVPYYLNYLNTGALSRRTPDAEVNDKLAALEVGRTKYSDILNRFGRPASDTHLAEGGRSVTYALAQKTNAASAPGAVASVPGPVVVTMTFDEHGRLENLSPSPQTASEASSSIAAPGRARNTLH